MAGCTSCLPRLPPPRPRRSRPHRAAPSTPGWPSPARWRRPGGCGGPTWPAGSGGPSARTTPRTATRGPRSRSSTPHARAYRWGEDGLGGISDRYGFLNFSVALWNGRDPILKERLFGLTNEEGNHGEDAKEYWWAVDGTPTHSWMQWLYRYPQAEFPYATAPRGERRADPAGARVRARRHRRPRRGPVLRRPGHLRQGVAGGRLHRRHRHQPRPRRRAAAPAAAGLVPQHLVLGPRQARRAR